MIDLEIEIADIINMNTIISGELKGLIIKEDIVNALIKYFEENLNCFNKKEFKERCFKDL